MDLYNAIVRKYTPEPNRTSFAALVVDPWNKARALGQPTSVQLLGPGIQVKGVTGRRTRFESFYQDTVFDPDRQPQEMRSYHFIGRIVIDTDATTDSQSEHVVGGKVILVCTCRHIISV